MRMIAEHPWRPGWHQRLAFLLLCAGCSLSPEPSAASTPQPTYEPPPTLPILVQEDQLASMATAFSAYLSGTVSAVVTLQPTPSGTPVVTETRSPTLSAPLPADRSHFRDEEELELTRIWMANLTDGWAIQGPYVLRTGDGGSTWKEVTPPWREVTPKSVFPLEPYPAKAFAGFADGSNAWVVFSQRYDDYADMIPDPAEVWATKDGGDTWLPTRISHGVVGDMWAEFYALNPSQVWVAVTGVRVGAGQHYNTSLLRTSDAGATWQWLLGEQFEDLDFGDFTGMSFSNENTGWATWQDLGPVPPSAPGYAVTTDGGARWNTRHLPPPDDVPRLFEDYEYSEIYQPNLTSSESIRLLVGSFNFSFIDHGDPTEGSVDYLYASDDGGGRWRADRLPMGVSALDATLTFFDPDKGLLMGRGAYYADNPSAVPVPHSVTVYRTDNGGRSWVYVKKVAWDGQFSFVDPLHGWAVARSGDALALVKTVDGGASWIELEPRAVR